MRRLIDTQALASLLLAASVCLGADDAGSSMMSLHEFDRNLRPLFEQRCIECHGPKKRKGGLRLDTMAALVYGGDSGPVLVPGDPSASLIIERVTTADEDERMPPKGKPLTGEQIALLKRWIQAVSKHDVEAALAADAQGRAEAATLAPSYAAAMGKNAEEHLILRRAERLRLVPAPQNPPEVAGPVHNAIDRFIVAGWERAGLPSAKSPPPLCDDATFLRRVYLDLLGVVPTLEETRKFLNDTSTRKREELIDELLARDVDYAAHWTTFWEDAVGSNPHLSFGGIVSRGDYRDWWFENFKKNEPYDVMAAELIDPAMPGHRSTQYVDILNVRYKASFLRDRNHTEILQTAADVGQLFLGTSMKCASCHSHFENDEWPQVRFLAFAGLFSSRDLEQIRCEKNTGRIVAAASPFDQPGIPRVAPEGYQQRLHLAAQLVTDPTNPRFAKTIVNRLWKRYLGLGLFEPIDDFRLDRPPSHPELLDWLAYDFMKNGYDLKHTIRLILQSRTYQLRYDPTLADRFDIDRPDDSRYFQSPGLRRLTAEQNLDSIRVVMSQRLDDGMRAYRLYHKRTTPLGATLGRPEARSEVSTGRSGEASIVQMLKLMNGAEFDGLISHGRLYEQIHAIDDPGLQARTLYLAVLSREPNDEELAAGAAFLSPKRGSGHSTRKDIVFDDFERPNYDRWAATGTAFGEGPVKLGEHVYEARIDGYRGERFVNSHQNSLDANNTSATRDAHTGRLRSAEFTIERDYIQLLVGGGRHPGRVCVNLVVDGRVIHSATGDNSPTLRPVRWDVREIGGKSAHVEVVDDVEGGWGHLLLDHIVFTDTGTRDRDTNLADIVWALTTSPAFQFIR